MDFVFYLLLIHFSLLCYVISDRKKRIWVLPLPLVETGHLNHSIVKGHAFVYPRNQPHWTTPRQESSAPEDAGKGWGAPPMPPLPRLSPEDWGCLLFMQLEALLAVAYRSYWPSLSAVLSPSYSLTSVSPSCLPRQSLVGTLSPSASVGLPPFLPLSLFLSPSFPPSP